MKTKAFSVREAVAVGWQKTLANLWRFFLVLMASWLVSALVNGFSRGFGERYFSSLVVSLLGWAILLVIQMGFLRVTLKALDGGTIGVKDFSTSLPEFLKFLGASILAGIVVAAGFFLFIIPGIILGLRLQFYSYLVIEKGLKPVEALKRSWEITRGRIWDLFILAIALFGIVILGALLIGVGLLVALPLAAVASAFVYRKLEAATPLSVQAA